MAIELTEKQKASLQNVKDGQPIPLIHAGKLKSAGYVVTNGRARPGYVNATITPNGLAALEA